MIVTKAVAEAAATPFSNNSSGETAADVKNTTMMKAQFSDVVTMWATIIDYKSYVYPETGSSFIQSLCYHLVNSQGGTRITGGDRIRDLHDVHLDITQEFSSQPIFITNGTIRVRTRNKYTRALVWENEPRYERVNQTPVYESTACRKKVGFQVLNKSKRCKHIDYYYAKEIIFYDPANNVLQKRKDGTSTAYYVQLDDTNTLDAKLYPIRESTPSE